MNLIVETLAGLSYKGQLTVSVRSRLRSARQPPPDRLLVEVPPSNAIQQSHE